MNEIETLHAKRGLIAILRGITPEEVVPVGLALLEAGIEMIEVPLNSPQPFESISLLVKHLPAGTLIGAGTVLMPSQVTELAACGGKLVISPNVNPAVIAQTRAHGMLSLPGAFTATEAFQALDAGAHALKIFPATVAGPKGISAMRAVLPAGTLIGAVGGVDAGLFHEFYAAGVNFFGLGSNLYKPGDNVIQVSQRARELVSTWDRLLTL